MIIVATGVVAATVSALALRRAQAWPALRQAGAGLGVAVASFLVLLGYQLSVQLFGPHRAAKLEYRNGVARPDEWILPTSGSPCTPVPPTGLFRAGLGSRK